MAAFQIFPPFVVFFNDQGGPVAGGEVRFYEADGTTPKDVYADLGLTINNGSTAALDSAGRLNEGVWGDGAYFVELYDADGVKLDEADNVQVPGGEAATLPALQSGKFLTNDGAVLSWTSVRQVPDPTGSSDKVLSTDGENLIWIDKPADGAAGVSDTTTTDDGFSVGDVLIQTGSDEAPASGLSNTSVSVTFPVAYDAAALHVSITPTSVSQPGPDNVTWNLTSAPSATGFTASFDVSEGNEAGMNKVVNPVPFSWMAIGKKAPAA